MNRRDQSDEDDPMEEEPVSATLGPVSEERRVQRRVALLLPVQFRTESQTVHDGTARDVSIGGMFVETDVRVAIATQLEMTLALPDDVSLTVPAVVRWSTAQGFGVQFGLLGAAATHTLVRLMRQQRAGPHS